MDEARLFALLDELGELEKGGEGEEHEVLRRLSGRQMRALAEEWAWRAHGGQRPPDGGWRTWLLRAGRGFGKTRAGAEYVWARVRDTPGAQIALVGATIKEAIRVMVKGPSGLIATAGTGEDARWLAQDKMVLLPGGAAAFVYGGNLPDSLRGPQHHHAWCDELAKWKHVDETWHNLMMGLRVGTRPRTIVTTTPRPIPFLRAVEARRGFARTGGRTDENVHTSAQYRADMAADYGGTRLGRQELDGELIEDFEGALWTRELIERCRVGAHGRGTVTFGRGGSGLRASAGESDCPLAGESDCPLVRIVIGVDPPASAGGTCGIVVCGVDSDGTGWVLADHSASGLSPDGWARRVAAAAGEWGAERVVAETNQGGDMVLSVLRAADCALPVGPVRAKYGKSDRAEPVAMRFERGRAKFAGAFPELEDQLCGLIAGGGYEGPGRSPDRADAMVWALAELLLGKRGEPRIRVL